MNREIIEQITITEALSRGYTQCGVNEGGWQHLININELDKSDFERGMISPAKKEAVHPSIDEDTVKDMLTDYIIDQWQDQTGDDDPVEIEDEIKKLDLDPFIDLINTAISKKYCHYLEMDIQIIPETPELLTQ